MYFKNLMIGLIFITTVNSFLLMASNQLTPELVMNLKSISNPKISPDGNYVAYIKFIPPTDEEGKKYRYNELNIMDLKSKETISIKKMHSLSSSSPIKYQWSQDSRSLYFTAKYHEIHELKQIYKILVENPVPKIITQHETDVGNFELTKDEKKIIILSKRKKTKEKIDSENNGFDWIINEQKFDFNYLYLWDIKNESAKKITPDSLHVFSFTLAPDDKNIIFQGAEQSLSDYSYMFRDIFRVSIDGSKNQKIIDHDGKLGKMAISPDGNYLAFLGGIDISDPEEGSLLLNKIGQPTWSNLTEGFTGRGITKGVLVGDAATRLKQTIMFDLPLVDKSEVQALMKSDVMGGGKRTTR